MKRWLTESQIHEKEKDEAFFTHHWEPQTNLETNEKCVNWLKCDSLSHTHTHLLLNSSNDTFKTAAAENLTKIYHDF